MNIIPSKVFLRKKILSDRKSFDEIACLEKNEQIIQNILRVLISLKVKHFERKKQTLGLYWPMKGEPDLLKLIIKSSYNTSLPKIKEDRIRFVKYEMGASMEMSRFRKIMQPVCNIETDPDIMIIPGLAFSVQGHRLGFGRGHYDKYLSKKELSFCSVNSKIRPIKIGVCFHENLYEYLPVEPHDIEMDFIITNKNIIVL